MRKKLLYFLFSFSLLITTSVLLPQEVIQTANSDNDSTKMVGGSEEIIVEKSLTEEEQIVKNAANSILNIYNDWSSDSDYELIYPVIDELVDEFYASWLNPEISMKEYYNSLKSIYTKTLASNLSIDPILKEAIDKELKRVNIVLTDMSSMKKALHGNYGNLVRNSINFIIFNMKVKEQKFSSYLSDLENNYSNIERVAYYYSILKKDVRTQTARIIEKRLNTFYITDGISDELKEAASILGDYTRSREGLLVAGNEEATNKAYAKKQDLKEKFNNYSGDVTDEKDDLRNDLRSADKAWVTSKNKGIDDLLGGEVERLVKEVAKFLKSPGIFDISDEIVLMLKNDSQDFKKEFTKKLEYKFYSPLVSKFQFYYKLDVVNGFRTHRTNVLVIILIIMAAFFYLIFAVKRKKEDLYIRRIAGLDAIDDAIGRATEMGKPIFYDSGLEEIKDPQTIASMLILKSVAKKVAEFKAELYFPAYEPIVMQVADEMIETGFMDAGFPEDYKKENTFLLSPDQFSYAAGLSGMIARKKPASLFHFGAYYAESLLISEAGFAAGSIQVAGTVNSTQLPFFIAACDHTLIGEEMYAAAAYLSREPLAVSNLKLSDYAKIVFGVLFLLSTFLLTIDSDWRFLVDIFETH